MVSLESKRQIVYLLFRAAVTKWWSVGSERLVTTGPEERLSHLPKVT